MREFPMGLLSIGEFARLSRLSPKALRLYDQLQLLVPMRVDPDSGYRWYDTGQLDRARLVATLRQLGVPLTRVKTIVESDPVAAVEQISAFWATVESEHTGRRELAGYLIDRLTGKSSVMDNYDVETRPVPERSVLCLLRHVDGEAGAWALGKEFIGILRDRPTPRMEGRTGAAFSIYHGEVNDDSDGPIEWCRPVPPGQAEQIAASYPALTMRTEPAHDEAYVHLGNTQASPPQWHLVSDALHTWVAEHGRQPGTLGVRVTYLATSPEFAGDGPDCDFALPLR